MFIEWPEGIAELGIMTKEFLEEYCILIEKSMYGNVDADLLWLRLLAKYLINECNPKIGKTDSFIFYKKDDIGRLELVMSVHVDDVFMAGNRETLEKIKDNIKPNSNIQDSKKVNKLLRVYHD